MPFKNKNKSKKQLSFSKYSNKKKNRQNKINLSPKRRLTFKKRAFKNKKSLGGGSKWTDFATWNTNPSGWKLDLDKNKDFFNFLFEYKDTIGAPIWFGKSKRDIFHTKSNFFSSSSGPQEKKTFVYLVNNLHILIIRYGEEDKKLSYILSKNPTYSIRSTFLKTTEVNNYSRYQYSFNESDDSDSFVNVKTMGVSVSGTIWREASKHFFMEYTSVVWNGTPPLQTKDIIYNMNSKSGELFNGFKTCTLTVPKDTSCWLQTMRTKLSQISKPIGHNKRIILNYSDKFLESPKYFDVTQDRILNIDDETLAQLKVYLKTIRNMQVLGKVNNLLDVPDARVSIATETVHEFFKNINID